VEAAINNVVAEISQLAASSWQLAISPNPVTTEIKIYVPNNYSEVSIKIFNSIGSAVPLPTAPDGYRDVLPTCILDVSSLSPGIYFLQITENKNQIHQFRFAVQR